jgi:hypothetical protein
MGNTPKWERGSHLEISTDEKLDYLYARDDAQQDEIDDLADDIEDLGDTVVYAADTKFKAGDKLTLTSCVLPGAILNSSKRFQCDLTLPKSVENVNFTVSKMMGGIRTILGSVSGTGVSTDIVGLEGYSIDVGALTSNRIRIRVNTETVMKVSTSTVTDSTPAAFAGTIDIDFTAKS